MHRKRARSESLLPLFLRFISLPAAGSGVSPPQWVGFFSRGWKFLRAFVRSGFRRKNSFGQKVRHLRTLSQRSARSPARSKRKASCTSAMPAGIGKITGNSSELGSWIWGFAAAMGWLFLPWLEILTRIRALRLPKEKQLRPKSPPSSDTFPALSEITREIEEEGFVHVGDAGWDWEDYRQFFRLFYREEDRAQAAICLIEQHDFSFYYL